VIAGADSKLIGENSKLEGAGVADLDRASFATAAFSPAAGKEFLRVPPFPGSRVSRFGKIGAAAFKAAHAAEAVKRLRVGGSFWAAQPPVPDDYVLVRSAEAVNTAIQFAGEQPIVVWDQAAHAVPRETDARTIVGECDPWHMLSGASAVIGEKDDGLRIIAALSDVAFHEFDPASGELRCAEFDALEFLEAELGRWIFENPFTGEPMDVLEAIELCGFWRRLIDSNRDIAGGVGFAFWKQAHVAPLLWGGSAPFRFVRHGSGFNSSEPAAIWRSKAGDEALAELERTNTPLIEVEDGFLRSHGLGADCIPPLSITVDRLGAHFDPTQPSELEILLETGEFDEALLERARDLRRIIVETGLGKYERCAGTIERPAGDLLHILVPGQVEDDRAVRTGGCGLTSNLELLRKVRAEAPYAYILYKPHPDVLAGHRRGTVSERSCLEYADRIVSDLPVSSLIAMVDEVHVNTSLAGFEALLRETAVTTYGAPFYAGWGLTRDLGPVPPRRTRKLSIDQLVAAALLLYPRYLDPVTGLPCPAEVVAARLSAAEERNPGLVVALRRLQGRVMRRFRDLVQ
jgi:capsular polysaccharide export protein